MKNVLFYEKGKDSEVITTSSHAFTQKWTDLTDTHLHNSIDIHLYANIDTTLIKGRLKVVYNTGNSVMPEEDGLAKLIGHIYVEFGGPRYEPNDDISGVTQIIQSISNDIEYKTHTGYYNSVAIIKKLENAKILWKHDTEILNYLDREIKYAQKHELKPAYFS